MKLKYAKDEHKEVDLEGGDGGRGGVDELQRARPNVDVKKLKLKHVHGERKVVVEGGGWGRANGAWEERFFI